jgi:hypothetical protein
MTHHWDEFSKSLVEETVPRRESLRRLGIALAGAVLSPLGLGTALARGSDPCKSFCNQCPKSQRNACRTWCRDCNNRGGYLCGTCGGGAICCPYPCCGDTCRDFASDVYNCGACGNVCGGPAPFCFEGACRTCEELGGTYCGGECVNLLNDPYNCGACGNVCGGSTPYCTDSVCNDRRDCYSWETRCGTVCVSTLVDENNCGGCGIVCSSVEACLNGLCIPVDQPPPTGY